MEVNCEGCAGCCLDWYSLFEASADLEGTSGRPDQDQRRTTVDAGDGRPPLDDDSNVVPLTREEIRGFLEAEMAAALTPRFWHARDDAEGVDVDGYTVAAVGGRPVFFVGLRKPPKPVAPFGREEPTWLPACVFLDPPVLQCRIYDDDLFPAECGAYPAHNLVLGRETECERVESAGGGERLLETAVPEDLEGPLLGTQALGAKLFAHPRPDDLEGIVGRAAEGELTPADRAKCLAVAASSSPGTVAVSDHHYERYLARALETTVDCRSDGRDGADRDASWVGPAIREWHRRKRDANGAVPDPDVATTVEDDRGAPGTPGWDGLE